MSKHDEPAFPTEIRNIASTTFYPGLTRLEYLSGLAMQGIVSNSLIQERFGLLSKETAQHAVEFATALLDELEKMKVK